MGASLEHYYQASPLHRWNQILGSLSGLGPENLFEVAMGLSSPQRDFQSQLGSSRGASPSQGPGPLPSPSPGGTVARGSTRCLQVSQDPGSVASSHRSPASPPHPPWSI